MSPSDFDSLREQWKQRYRDQAGFEGELRFDEPLSKHTYYRIGGPAAVFAIPKGRADLIWLLSRAQGLASANSAQTENAGPAHLDRRVNYSVPHWIGLGSNLLISDSGVPSLVIKTNQLDLGIEEQGDELIVGASVPASTLLRQAGQRGYQGFEFLAGIPGAIGGCIAMNAGTHLGEVKDRIRWVEWISLEDAPGFRAVRRNLTSADFSYRHAPFLDSSKIVVRSGWTLCKGEPGPIKEVIHATLIRRKETQPLSYPSCGSVFKNPRSVGKHAWQVIDQLGLRGHRIGGAQFSEKHPNFIINLGGALAADVLGLIQLAQLRARQELAISLETEVRLLGFENDTVMGGVHA